MESISTTTESMTSSSAAELRTSTWTLVGANALPLLGVLFLGWRAFDVVFLYWTENVVIGVINLLKMMTCQPEDGLLEDRLAKMEESQLNDRAKESLKGMASMGSAKWFFMPFFTVHYGIFCVVHCVFIVTLLNRDGPLNVLQNLGIWVSIAALAISHLVSYFTNFLGGGEYRRTTLPDLMQQPYPRIMVLHIAIVLSGFFVVMLGSPIWMLVLLVIGKTMLDLKLHKKEHLKLAAH